MRNIKKHVRLTLGILLLIMGIALMLIPFLPVGYLFIFIALFFLATYIPPLNRFLDYLKEKDQKGKLAEMEKKIKNFENQFEDSEKEDPQDEK